MQMMSNLFGTYFSWTTSQISQWQISTNKQPILSFPGQPPRFHIWNFQWIPVSNHCGTMFIMSNQNSNIQKMNNHYVYCSLWATAYFSLKFFSKLEMCQRGPGDAGRILPLVLSYLIRYPLGTMLVPFGTSFNVPLVPYSSRLSSNDDRPSGSHFSKLIKLYQAQLSTTMIRP